MQNTNQKLTIELVLPQSLRVQSRMVDVYQQE